MGSETWTGLAEAIVAIRQEVEDARNRLRSG